MKKLLLLALFVVGCVFGSEFDLKIQQRINCEEKKCISKSNFFGENLQNAVSFMPIGNHTVNGLDVFDVSFAGITYKNIELAIFKNTFREWTYGLLYGIGTKISSRIYINYGLGLLYGYNGKLSKINHIPLKDSFLFTGQINPVGIIDIDLILNSKSCFQIRILPLVIIYGIKFYY